MKALIFAAGLGTRLKPITDTMPKALVPVAGRPLLHHVAHKIIDAGISDIVINAHHFAGQIVGYVASQDGFGVHTDISVEEERPLETGGGIKKARKFLEGDDFLVHNVDILSNLDIRWFISQARPDAVATLLVSERKTTRYLLFDESMRLKGWTNVKTGEIKTPFPVEDLSGCRRLAFSGIHFISSRIFGIMDGYAAEDAFPIIDFYLRIAAQHPIYGVIPENFKMMDVGKVDSLAAAEGFLAELEPEGGFGK